MKKSILILAIYFSGVFFGYKYVKYNLQNTNGKEWTVRDRNAACVLSSASWFTVIAMVIVDSIQSTSNDKPSNW